MKDLLKYSYKGNCRVKLVRIDGVLRVILIKTGEQL